MGANNLIKKLTLGSVAFLILIPLAVHAQGSTFDTILGNISFTLSYLITVLMVAATVVFMWGVIKFIASAGDPALRAKSKSIMVWGIVGLVVMASAWGIAAVLINYFLGGPGTTPIYVKPPIVS